MLRVVGRLADGWMPVACRGCRSTEVLPKQDAIDEAARKAGRDPAAIRRVANLNGVIADGAVTDWLRGPVDHWVEEIVKLVRDLRFTGFVAWFDDEDQLGADRALRDRGRCRPCVSAAWRASERVGPRTCPRPSTSATQD